MRMTRDRSSLVLTLTLALTLAACASRADQALEAVRAAASILHEWAFVEQERGAGSVPHTFAAAFARRSAEQLRQQADDLRAARPDLSAIIDRARTGQVGAASLEAAARVLNAAEAQLETA